MRTPLRNWLNLLLALFILPTVTNATGAKVKIDPTKQIKITYISPSWNTDSKTVDSAFLMLRDGGTGKIVQIQLEETAPDSSEFTGVFAITWTNVSSIAPEIYIPPQNLRNDSKQLLQLVTDGKLPRKPIIARKDENGQEVIDVFDNKDEATAAWNVYQEQVKLSKKKLLKPVPSKENIDAAQQADYQKQMLALEKQAVANESDRVRMERVEREKLALMQKNFQKLPTDKQAERQANAKRLFEQGMESYKNGDYPAAEKKFHAAIEADPLHTGYYFNYGVAIYRQDRFNQAMVEMRIAPDEQQTVLEKKYYMGLIHLKLKELKEATQLFDEVGASKDPVLGPSAMFYKGVLLYSDGKFEQAKKPFEQVLDTSKDPDLDKQAEEFLDRVNSALMYKKMQEQPWNITGLIGAFYDSNVLLAPDNQGPQGSVLHTGDMRLLTMGTLEYRPILNEHNELTLRGTVNLTNSSKSEVAIADPWIYTFEAPYSYKGVLWGKGYKLTVRPGYEVTYMALTLGSPKTAIFSSPYLALDNTFIMQSNWYSTYTIQYRRDNSEIPLSGDGTDYTANQYYLKTQQMFIFDKAKLETLSANGGFVRNEALGAQRTYSRYELGAVYSHPLWSNFLGNVGLTYYYLTYPDYVPTSGGIGRIDNNYTLTAGLSKPINDWFTWGVTATYADNPSTVPDIYQYSKYIIMTTATFNKMF